MALSLLGSANLIRPGLLPNGSSHTASRHRHLGKGRVLARPGLGGWEWRPQRKGPAPSQGAGSYPTHPYGKGNDRARKEHF